MLKDTLLLFNEWWETKEISKGKAKEYKRRCYSKIKKIFKDYKQILILTGLRRVGKTTIMFQLIDDLLRKKVNPKHIFYFSFDELVRDPITLLKTYSEITNVNWKKENIYVFFDEIQKLPRWGPKIKILYDNFPNMKIVLSGSASIALQKEAIKNLAGRYFSEKIQVLSLQEFSELKLRREIPSFDIYKEKISKLYKEYIHKPFPELVAWEDIIEIKRYIKELVVDRIFIDIPETFSSANPSLLSTLTNIFMNDVGMILDATSLSKQLGIHKATLQKHIHYLEFRNLINIVKNYRPSIRSESRKMKKIYPAHISLAFAHYAEPNIGRINESLVQSSLQLDKYWRDSFKREVDFIKLEKGKLVPIEVKTKETINKNEVSSLIYFMKKFKIKKGYVIYQGEEKNIKLNGMEIILKPIEKVLFGFSL